MTTEQHGHPEYKEYGVDIPMYTENESGPFNKEDAQILLEYLGYLRNGKELLLEAGDDAEEVAILTGAENLIRDLWSMVYSYEYDFAAMDRRRHRKINRRRNPKIKI
jgi:hypothetical protein